MSPAAAGAAWLERSVEQQRHNAVCDRLERLEAMLLALCNRFGLETPE
jgi:hypothetical protein